MALAVDNSAVVYTYIDWLRRVSSATGAPFTISTGNLLLVEISGYFPTTPGASSVTHNGVPMARVAAGTSLGNVWVERWYLLNPTTGQTVVNLNSGQFGLVITCVEISGADASAPIVGETAITGTNATLSASLTTSNNGALLIGSLAADNGGTPVTSDGTLLHSGELSDTSRILTYGTASKAVATAGSASLGFTWQNSDDAVVTVVELKPAASSGTTYTQSTSNTTTRAASTLKTTSKAISDGATRAISTLKMTGKTFSYGSMRADSTVKTIGKSVSNTATRTSSSQVVVVFVKALANAMTRASTTSLSTTFAQVVSNTRTRTSSVLKVVGKTLSNAKSAALSVGKLVGKPISAAASRVVASSQIQLISKYITKSRSRAQTSSQTYTAGLPVKISIEIASRMSLGVGIAIGIGVAVGISMF